MQHAHQVSKTKAEEHEPNEISLLNNRIEVKRHGHLNKTEMIMPPKHAAYSSFGSDPIGGIMYYYSPEGNFKGTDTIKFKSFEPSINKTIVSTYWIKIRG